jgi:hypothetical protein
LSLKSHSWPDDSSQVASWLHKHYTHDLSQMLHWLVQQHVRPLGVV